MVKILFMSSEDDIVDAIVNVDEPTALELADELIKQGEVS